MNNLENKRLGMKVFYVILGIFFIILGAGSYYGRHSLIGLFQLVVGLFILGVGIYLILSKKK